MDQERPTFQIILASEVNFVFYYRYMRECTKVLPELWLQL